MITKPVSIFNDNNTELESLLNKEYLNSVKTAYDFLREKTKTELRTMAGQRLDFIPDFSQVDKSTFVKSYQKPVQDDILAGYGLFKITEGKILQIDWTGGHYQLPLGYHSFAIDKLLTEAREIGIVDDTHNNTPGMAVKLLASELVKCANMFDNESLEGIVSDENRLNRVTSVDTGTVASSTGLKSILYRFQQLYGDRIPVFIMQEGNYHGTDFLEQRLRDMWKWLFANIIVEFAEPNNIDDLYAKFQKYENSRNEKVASVIMEPVLMNNRAIYLKPDYMHKAKELCIKYDAILFLDEIQTGLWSPEVFMSNEYNGVADLLSIGKGLTNGYSPLAYSICKGFLDNQNQYSSISTNGNADMAALAGLIVLQSVKNNSEHIKTIGNYYFDRLNELQRLYPDKVTEITGYRHLAGINIVNESMAGKFHHKCLEQGIFVRLQAYKEGASTIITKPPIIADADDVDVVIDKMIYCLKSL